jgi:hypothetical protein
MIWARFGPFWLRDFAATPGWYLRHETIAE